MSRSEINHPTLGRMWTVPRAARFLQLSVSELKRRMRDQKVHLVEYQERPGSWRYVTVASVAAEAAHRFARPGTASHAD